MRHAFPGHSVGLALESVTVVRGCERGGESATTPANGVKNLEPPMHANSKQMFYPRASAFIGGQLLFFQIFSRSRLGNGLNH